MRAKIHVVLLVVFFMIPAFCVVGYSFRCLGCRGGAEVLKFLYERNATKGEIIKAAFFICKHFADHDSYICQGITSQFQDEFLYVVEQLILRPSQLCGVLVAGCGVPHNPFDSDWSIPLPPKATTQQPAIVSKSGKQTLKVLQLSDLHFDYKYVPGSEAHCGLDLCCQGRSRGEWTGRKVVQPAGYWGTLADCDLPYWTIENMFQHINKTHEVDYVLLSGDYMSHSDWTYSQEDHLHVVSNLTRLVNTYMPLTPVYWALGNHEGVPVNSFAPHFTPEPFWPKWIYKAISNAEAQWLPEKARKETIYRGSYSVMVADRLKLITVNTGYCETTNFFLYINQTDPDGTMSWLVDELYQAERSSIYVHIMAHIPPGDGECLEGWARNYYRVVNRFESTIKAQFFGHIHTDSFVVFYEDMDNWRSRPSGVLYVAPSVTTYSDINPAYRLYTIDANNYEVIDFETHYLNLSTTRDQDSPLWEKLYSAKDEYEMESLNASSWHELSERIRSDGVVYRKFLKNYARRDDYPCGSTCRTELLCSLRRGHHNDSALCGKTHWESSVRARPSMSLSAFQRPPQSEMDREKFGSDARHAIWAKIRRWIREG